MGEESEGRRGMQPFGFSPSYLRSSFLRLPGSPALRLYLSPFSPSTPWA